MKSERRGGYPCMKADRKRVLGATFVSVARLRLGAQELQEIFRLSDREQA